MCSERMRQIHIQGVSICIRRLHSSTITHSGKIFGLLLNQIESRLSNEMKRERKRKRNKKYPQRNHGKFIDAKTSFDLIIPIIITMQRHSNSVRYSSNRIELNRFSRYLFRCVVFGVGFAPFSQNTNAFKQTHFNTT